jgi:hypothetical protein
MKLIESLQNFLLRAKEMGNVLSEVHVDILRYEEYDKRQHERIIKKELK